MDRLGDLDSEMVQELAAAIARKHMIEAAEGLDNGLRIQVKKERFKERAQVFDHGQMVFDATRYADGDQIVSKCLPGNWKIRLRAAA